MKLQITYFIKYNTIATINCVAQSTSNNSRCLEFYNISLWDERNNNFSSLNKLIYLKTNYINIYVIMHLSIISKNWSFKSTVIYDCKTHNKTLITTNRKDKRLSATVFSFFFGNSQFFFLSETKTILITSHIKNLYVI